MKRLLVLLAATLFLFLLPPKSVSAQCNAATGFNCFQCRWTGIECVVDFGNLTCEPGFVWDDSVCNSINNISDCQGQTNNDCVSIAPTATPPPEQPCTSPNVCFRFSCPVDFSQTSDRCSFFEDVCCRPLTAGTPTPTPTPAGGQCFECVDTITGCIPRSIGDPRCEYPDVNSCNDACTGAVPTKYRCDGGNCFEDFNGPFESLGACASACGGGGDAVSDPTCGPGGEGINTALGCIPVSDTNLFTGFLIRLGIGIGGGIAFLLILYSGFMITTSSGDPKKLQAGRELLTSAIAGLLLIIFAAFILRLIGVDLLGIPEFGQ